MAHPSRYIVSVLVYKEVPTLSRSIEVEVASRGDILLSGDLATASSAAATHCCCLEVKRCDRERESRRAQIEMSLLDCFARQSVDRKAQKEVAFDVSESRSLAEVR